ncbi:MAG: hypothetical protein IT423_11585 [Pirellulaceae bacterium]|nr:hypothetical protein [Pirellulaceae bacterium]
MHRNSVYALLLVAGLTQAAAAADYAKDISPLWKRSCVACHNSKKAEGGLNLETAAMLLKGSDSGQSVIAGKSAESELLKRIVATDDTAMPPKDNSAGAKPLTPAEIELVKQWIDAGAMPGEDGLPTSIAWQAVPGNFQPIYAIDTTVDGQFVATGRGNQVVVHNWPLQASATSAVALVDPQTIINGAPSAHLDLVQSVAFSPDANLLATGGYRCVKLWKRDATPSALVGLKNSTGVATNSTSGQWLALARDDKSIDIVDVVSRQVTVKIPAAAAAITAIAWSLDDQVVFAADGANNVTRWQLPPAGAAAGTAPTSLAFAAPGPVGALAALAQDRVAVMLSDGQVSLWVAEAATAPEAKGAVSFVKKDFAEAIPAATSMAVVAGDPVKLLVAQADGTIRAVHAMEAKVVGTWKSPVGVTKLAAHPKSPQVASLGVDGSLRLWNVADGKEISNIVPDTAMSREAARGGRTAARQKAEVDRLAATIKELETAHQKEQEAMKKVADEREKAAAALATKVTEYDTNTNGIKEAEKGIETAKAMIAEQMKRIETLTAEIEAKKKKEPELLAAKNTAMEGVTKQDQTLASAKEAVDRAAKAIPAQQAVVEAGKATLTNLEAISAKLVEQAKAAREEVPVSFGFDASGKEILVGRKQGAITVVNLVAGRVSMEVKSAPNLASVIGVGRMLVAASSGAPLSVWNSDTAWKLERTIGSETDPASLLSDRVTALAFSPDGQTLAIGSGPASRFGDVKLVRTSDGSIVRDLGEVHSDTVLDVAFSPDGGQLATCGADKLVRVFDLASGKQRLALEGHTHHVLSVAWQDSGNVLASASADGTVKVWNMITGEQQRTVSGFAKEITSLAYVGQTSQFLAACADNSLRLVEGNNGQTVRSFGGSTSALYALCLSTDNKQVMAGGQEGKLIIWAVDDAKVVKQLD